MIKFFRKIRQDFLSEGKTGRYFKYAIGEIVLVVIGILIALQINNWNEANKIATAEQQILKDIKNELLANIENLESVTKSGKLSMENAKILNQFYSNPSKLTDFPADSIANLTYTLIGDKFFPENAIINSIISTGQLNYIKKPQLKQALASLQDKVEEKMLSTELLMEDGAYYLNRDIYPKIGYYIKDGKVITTDFKEIYSTPVFSIVLAGTFGERRNIALKKEEELMRMYKDIINLIDREIQK